MLAVMATHLYELPVWLSAVRGLRCVPREAESAVFAHPGLGQDSFRAVRAFLGSNQRRGWLSDGLWGAARRGAWRQVTPFSAIPILLAGGTFWIWIPAGRRQAGGLSTEEKLDDDAEHAQ